jgi:hypothetical protein
MSFGVYQCINKGHEPGCSYVVDPPEALEIECKIIEAAPMSWVKVIDNHVVFGSPEHGRVVYLLRDYDKRKRVVTGERIA